MEMCRRWNIKCNLQRDFKRARRRVKKYWKWRFTIFHGSYKKMHERKRNKNLSSSHPKKKLKISHLANETSRWGTWENKKFLTLARDEVFYDMRYFFSSIYFFRAWVMRFLFTRKILFRILLILKFDMSIVYVCSESILKFCEKQQQIKIYELKHDFNTEIGKFLSDISNQIYVLGFLCNL